MFDTLNDLLVEKNNELVKCMGELSRIWTLHSPFVVNATLNDTMRVNNRISLLRRQIHLLISVSDTTNAYRRSR